MTTNKYSHGTLEGFKNYSRKVGYLNGGINKDQSLLFTRYLLKEKNLFLVFTGNYLEKNLFLRLQRTTLYLKKARHTPIRCTHELLKK